MPAPELRLRAPTPGLLALPWDQPLAQWLMPDVPLRDVAVGASRHLVKFVECDGALWAVKELPPRLAVREYDVLRHLEDLALNAVRPAGLVVQPDLDSALLVTRYLEGSWQYRRLLMRLPPEQSKQRARLYDAMASLLVEIHRHGVFWGDCSLANTLFSRDGQVLAAWFVDAETSEVHPQLSRGQRELDIDILVENVAAGLDDLAARLDWPAELRAILLTEAVDMRRRYETLWETLHSEPVFEFADRYRVESAIRKLHDLGFAVDEIGLAPTGAGDTTLRLHVAVGDRRYHATHLRALTGLDVGEGAARILLGDLQAYQVQLCGETGEDVSEPAAAQLWLREVALPGMELAHSAVRRSGTAVQAYCDLLEVRWLLSEKAGHDVGTAKAVAALMRNVVPGDSAAKLVVVETPTEPFTVVFDDEL